ncbi:MAG: NAD(+)/NADH kinase [Anaerolineae bacterium]|nr:NAD(+)/NADH kinase [Anaerolineae bacterium]
MMTEDNQPIRRIAIVGAPNLSDTEKESIAIAGFLNERGVETQHGFLYDEAIYRKVKQGEFDVLIALGGDGTMLRAGHLGGPSNVPILGINLGRIGILTEIAKIQWPEYLERLIAGDYWLEKRMMLNAEQWRADSLLGRWDVLNEVVVSRGQIIRPVHVTAQVDGRFLTTYVAAALIAATPTGSTAYALAAGGPILPPELRNILLGPVAPHLSLDRAIVLAEGSSVSITVNVDHQAVFSIDGQVPIGLTSDDRVAVYASPHVVKFVRFQDPGYFYRNLTPHMSQNPSTANHR